MADKKITDLQLISALTGTENVPVDDSIQTYRATVNQFQTFITKLTTRGDLMYRAASDNERLAKGTEGQFLRQGANDPAWASFVAPTVQKFLSTGTTVGYLFTITSGNATVGATYTNNGNTYTVLNTIAAQTVLWCSQSAAPQASGTLTKSAGTGDATLTFSAAEAIAAYTLPSSPRAPLFIRVKMVGAGGGGSGGAITSSGNGGSGTVATGTRFGFELNCSPGVRATGGGGAVGTGGAASLGTGPIGTAITGASGNGYSQSSTAGDYGATGGGGHSALGGAGGGGRAGDVGITAATNSGSGGGGGSGGSAGQGGSGGGAGGFIDAMIASPAATIYYKVGVGGTGGAAGTSGAAGGAGAAGYIEVTEHYQ